MGLWDEPRVPDPPRRGWRDWALVAVLGVAVVVEGLVRPEVPAGAVLLTLALVPGLLWRRSRPLLVVVIAFGATGLAPIVDERLTSAYTLVFLLMLPYALVRWGSGRAVVIGSALVLAQAGVTTALDGTPAADIAGGFAVLVAAMALGAALRFRARARSRELEQARLVERERLARDLHDTVAHHVSAMAVRAQAGLAVATPDAATDALRLIEAEASRALAELRSMVRTLRRDDPAELGPSPRIADLERLATSTGPVVDVEITGRVDELPETIGNAIFRLAQESVTNARRHARHATRIEVRVSADDTAVKLRVHDDGTAGPVTGDGYGLVGMKERAELLGGTCEAGPDPGGGWTVTATLPRA